MTKLACCTTSNTSNKVGLYLKVLSNGCLRTIVPLLNTYKSGGVVVTGCLGVTVSLEDRVSLHNLVLKGTL